MPLSRKRAVEAPLIPDRLYFKIGDVARICGLETYVLRFWETQFPQLKPNKSGTGQRLYRRRDVELVLEIKRLVHVEGYTLPGARQALETGQRGQYPSPNLSPDLSQIPNSLERQGPQSALPLPGDDQGKRRDAVASAIGHVRAELREIAGLLASPAPAHLPPRRRARLATIPAPSGTLFHS